MTGRDRTEGPSPSWLVVIYLVAMPFLAGLPRGTIVPLLRPSEALQLVLTIVAVGWGATAVLGGGRWRLALRPTEWWLLAVATAGSALPLLWFLARGRTVGSTEILAAFPFVKFAALYLLARATVRTSRDLERVVVAIGAAATAIAAIAIAQSLGFGPVTDVLGRFFVSSADDLVDDGRGTTTIGSSIATGAYLSIGCGLFLSLAFSRGQRRWYTVAAVLGIGALASGQAGSVIALMVMVVAVARFHRRSRQLAAWGFPMATLVLVALWPIVAARLAAVDQGTGIPSSWVIRWNNVTELYWPDLASGGWLFGVSPNAILEPPDVWREAVYLESGYLWLLWVGGLPLLVAVVGFLVSAWRHLGRAPMANTTGSLTALTGTRLAARASVAMMAVLTVIDPHLTLRAGADLFFVMLALGTMASPLVVSEEPAHRRWLPLLRADQLRPLHPRARLQLAESEAGGRDEIVIALSVQEDGDRLARANLALHRIGPDLHGVVTDVSQADPEAAALLWRGLALCGHSLRLTSLRHRPPGPRPGLDADRGELRLAAGLARRLEADRTAGFDPRPISRAPSTEGAGPTGGADRPAIRIELTGRFPAWKRLTDLALGALVTLASAPLWLVSAAAIRRSGPGPVLFRQVRVGAGGLPFQIYKFRTMHLDNDDTLHRQQNRRELLDGAEAVKEADDPRIIPLGRWLRRLSLDELPQLLNVLRGEMSLVGPRPSLLWEVELFAPAQRRRLQARPGLTGLWQISGRADVSMNEMLDLDLAYVDSMGPMVDLRCLVGTASSVIGGRGAR